MDFSTLLASTATVLTFSLIYLNVKRFSFWSSRGIKGPTPIPFLGTNAYLFLETKIKQDQLWHDQYGKTFGSYEGFIKVLRTSDSELIKHVFIKDFSNFAERNSLIVYGDTVPNWLFFSKQDHWANQRALITPLFTSMRMKDMLKIITSCAERFHNEISRRMGLESSPEKTKKNTFSRDELMGYTLDGIAAAFFGLKLDTYKDRTSDFFKRAFAFAVFDVPYFLFWLCIPSFVAKTFKMNLVTHSKYEYFEKLCQTIINERRKESSPHKRFDLMQQLLDAELPETFKTIHTKDDDAEAHYNAEIGYRELDRHVQDQAKSVKFRKFDDKEIQGQVTFFFLAGFETTSATLTACMFELAHQQGIQQELHDEMQENNLDSKKNCDIEYTYLTTLKKLDAFISEVLRIYPPVTEITRMCTNPKGASLPTNPPVHLPYGALVTASTMVVHKDPDYWTEPHKFDMTRFYPENKGKIKTGSYMPFGLGPRNCAGLRFALMNVKVCLISILLKYQVKPGPKNQHYPPIFIQHSFFNQFENTDYCLIPRAQA